MAVIAASAAFTKTFGLLVTFLGIGLLVNGLLAFIVIGILVERAQNKANRGG